MSNKMQRHTIYLYLETALHVLSGTFTHHQERKQLYLEHLVFVTPLLLSAAIVEEIHLFALLMMDGSTTRNMKSIFQINKLCNVAACWTYIRIQHKHFKLPATAKQE
jgi:hypothetical protein